ncbi:MAG: hypothetical protein DRR08_27440, partial [Candidatus Parabeggiatoa sp. nov. 2]
KKKHQAKVKTIVFTAVNRIVDKAETVVCEDLTKTFKSRNLEKKYQSQIERLGERFNGFGH